MKELVKKINMTASRHTVAAKSKWNMQNNLDLLNFQSQQELDIPLDEQICCTEFGRPTWKRIIKNMTFAATAQTNMQKREMAGCIVYLKEVLNAPATVQYWLQQQQRIADIPVQLTVTS